MDISRTNCAVKKRILDCVATQNLSPVDVDFTLDKVCGKHMFGQKSDTTPFNQCNYGWRQAEPCESDEDCPLTPSQFHKKLLMASGKPKLSRCCKITKDSKEHNGSPTLGARTSSCGNRFLVGCQAAVQRQCADLGPYLQLAAMA